MIDPDQSKVRIDAHDEGLLMRGHEGEPAEFITLLKRLGPASQPVLNDQAGTACLVFPTSTLGVKLSLEGTGGRAITLPSGCCIFLPPSLPFRLEVAAPQKLIELRAVAKVFDRLTAREPKPDFSKEHLISDQALRVLCDEIRRHRESDAYQDGAYGTLLLHAMAERIYCATSGIELADQGGLKLSTFKMQRVDNVIDEALPGSISTARLAAAAGLSQSHFSRTFRKTTGETPQSYVMGRRVLMAMALICEERFSLREVARMAGFASQTHMTTTFGNKIGMTPAAFARTTSASQQ
jgi:AraC family transcriptional regulator